MKSVRLALIALAAVVFPAAAQACTSCSCTTSTAAVSFGAYSPVNPLPTDATGLVQIDCTGLIALLGTVEVRAGAGSSGSPLQRTMVRGGATLKYNLYSNLARTQILGDGTGGTTTLSAPLNGLLIFSTAVPVYARMPAGQWVAGGSYGDTVLITVSY